MFDNVLFEAFGLKVKLWHALVLALVLIAVLAYFMGWLEFLGLG